LAQRIFRFEIIICKFVYYVEGPLLNEIGLIMESRSNNYNRTRKMHLYSGHDISVKMTMSFLGNTIQLPDFGASLHFHLYYDEINEHTIKVWYLYYKLPMSY